MAAVIRFARHGAKKKPYFRIVVQHKRAARDGRFIEHIGSFIPAKDALTVSRPRLEYWVSVGAEISTAVKNRLKKFMVKQEQPAETLNVSEKKPTEASQPQP
ncbi:MAG: 30S ribosomal protein S16 [Deltaproteobacteria bacterium]|nr:30S ribosomal protein S16 [Deltaproteobacteria bacterium]